MKIRKVRVNGDVATCLPDNATDFTHEVNLTNAEYDKAVNSSYFKVVDGDPVVKTQADRDADQLVIDQADWKRERESILNSAVVLFNGNYIDMSDDSQSKIVRMRDSLSRRNKTVRWKVQDSSTGAKIRVELSRSDINEITDAVLDASQIVHEAADTGMPVSPWPLVIT